MNRQSNEAKGRKTKEWSDLSKSEKTKSIIGLIAIIFILFIFIPSFMGGDKSKSEEVKQAEKTANMEASKELVAKVEGAIERMGDELSNTIASFGETGRQGQIEGVKSWGSDGVEIEVSTYFEKTGNEEDGGQKLAHNILLNICTLEKIPELKSLSVHSTSSGMDSKAVYSSNIPACNR